MKKLRIGLIASNWRSIPGGIKNVFAPGLLILTIADRLTEMGHEVTLFAPKGTKTKAKLVHEGLLSPFDEYHHLLKENLALYVMIERGYELVLISKAFEMAKEGHFDILHAHKTNFEPFFANLIDTPLVVTSHQSYKNTILGVTTPADLYKLKKYAHSIYYTAISKYISKEVDLNFVDVVYNGIDTSQFTFKPNQKRSGLLFVGRITPGKGPDTAIEVAEKLNMPLDLIGDRRYNKANEEFWQKIEPRLKAKGVRYHGFVPSKKTAPFYQQAKLTLFPIREPEPFGLVMAESMACGTPVIAYNLGSASEIIEDGKTGFLIKPGDKKAMTKAAQRIIDMSDSDYAAMQLACHERVQAHFTFEKMVEGYEAVYHNVIEQHQKRA